MLRLGYVPLVDAAPLIAAAELGYFAGEGLSVVLQKQIGWGNVRDKLTFGELDAAHALIGMCLFSVLGRDWFAEPLVAVMGFGPGCNAITLSRRLTAAGVNGAASLADYLRGPGRRETLVFAHVFGCSMHHYLLRRWLASAGISPDEDVTLRVFPPNQMPAHLASGHIAGFCAGEPWNMAAEHEGVGTVVELTERVLPGHPEKVLAVSRRWADHHEDRLPALLRALLRSCAWCNDPKNAETLAGMLAKPAYLDMPAALLAESLALRPIGSAYDMASTFPSRTHYLWFIEEMVRWGHLSPDRDPIALANDCTRSGSWHQAAAELGITGPVDDYPPMPLGNGAVFEGRQVPSHVPP